MRLRRYATWLPTETANRGRQCRKGAATASLLNPAAGRGHNQCKDGTETATHRDRHKPVQNGRSPPKKQTKKKRKKEKENRKKRKKEKKEIKKKGKKETKKEILALHRGWNLSVWLFMS
jgi:hypothetical protein